jgi:hypothetical protein
MCLAGPPLGWAASLLEHTDAALVERCRRLSLLRLACIHGEPSLVEAAAPMTASGVERPNLPSDQAARRGLVATLDALREPGAGYEFILPRETPLGAGSVDCEPRAVLTEGTLEQLVAFYNETDSADRVGAYPISHEAIASVTSDPTSSGRNSHCPPGLRSRK